MNYWTWAIFVYAFLIVGTMTPIFLLIIRKRPEQCGDFYSGYKDLDEGDRVKLQENLDILYRDDIGLWSRKLAIYSGFQVYSLIWTILASVMVPILAQALDDRQPGSKWFLTLISVHASVLLGLNKGFSIDDRVKLYREAMNDFSDLNRLLRVRPDVLTTDRSKLVTTYVQTLDTIVVTTRTGEAGEIVLPDPSKLVLTGGVAT